MRGLDSDGHAANFVETEQIIEYDYTKCSFVQVIFVYNAMLQTFSMCLCIKYKHLFIVTISSIFHYCYLHQCPKKISQAGIKIIILINFEITDVQ